MWQHSYFLGFAEQHKSVMAVTPACDRLLIWSDLYFRVIEYTQGLAAAYGNWL